MDVKDILGLPKGGYIQEKKEAIKESHRKPDGISRELYALTGKGPSSADAPQLKHSSQSSNNKEKASWKWLPFANSAHKDNLQLSHWARVVNGRPPTDAYSFAKCNKHVEIVKYTDEEYQKYLTDPVWTKDETDQLFDLCERFDLRFIIIADRFPADRSVEELKDRYYIAARSILVSRASSADISAHPLVKEPYNAFQERERKRALSMVLSQTKHQERKDSEILAEAKRILESCAAARRAEELELLNASNTVPEISEKDVVPGSPPSSSAQLATTSAAESASAAASLRMDIFLLRIYSRTYALDQMVQAVSTSVGLRTIKRVEQTLQELGVNLKPKVHAKAVCVEHLELRKEILTLLNLQKQLQYKGAEGSSYRDGSFSETPLTHKRAVDQDSLFIPEPLSFGGDRVGKRDQKRKAPGRSEAPLAAHKRPRKLKALD